ncbi:MAG: archaemetzincin family Zn-dependent metalloprotease [Ignavibacteria bacterium]|nr:archaemetzincin family Zn-dependent metalloprotease [Ignavibacteria bacterium]
MSSILLVPIGKIVDPHIPLLKTPLEATFGLRVDTSTERSIDPAFAFEPSRNQYYSTQMIKHLLHLYSSFQGKILGVTPYDLYVPVLTYVFGEAQLDGTAAVVSSYRLDNSYYGLPADPLLLEQRLIKEAVHELGHTFGLLHCHEYECVMHSSTAVEDIDLKGERLCGMCTDVLARKNFRR